MTAVTAGTAAPIRWRLTWATARRVLTQLRHDPRTVVMLIAVPSVLMVLLRYVLNNPAALNRFAPEFIGVFPFIIMFIIAAVTTQRERARGTLERLMAMPLGKLDLLAGYAIAFGLVACVQVGVVLVISLTWLGARLPGSVVPLVVVAVLDALLGMSLGLFASAFARTEFQAVQFMPALVLPQALLCGIVVARSQMTDVLRWLSDVLPLSYAVDAMQQIGAGASWSGPANRGHRCHPRVHRRRTGRRGADPAPPHPLGAARCRNQRPTSPHRGPTALESALQPAPRLGFGTKRPKSTLAKCAPAGSGQVPDRLVIRAVIRAGDLPLVGSSEILSANPDVRRRRPASKRLFLFSARSMARLVRFQRIWQIGLSCLIATPNPMTVITNPATLIQSPTLIHLHRLIDPDHREGKGNVYLVNRRYPHSLWCRTRSSCQRDARVVGHLTTSHSAHRTEKDPASLLADSDCVVSGVRPALGRRSPFRRVRPGIPLGSKSTPRNARAAQRPRSRNGMTF